MLKRIIVLACAVGLASPSMASAAPPPAGIVQKALTTQAPSVLKTSSTAKAANKVPASYNASLMVCPRNSTGAFYVLSPYMEPRDTTQNGWVGFFDVVYRRDTSGWVKRFTTQPLYHHKPADIFEQATQTNSMSWQDAQGNASSGDFKYTGRRGSWYLVLTYYIWAAQPSYPYPDNDLLAANQDPYGQSQRGTLCQAGVDNYGD